MGKNLRIIQSSFQRVLVIPLSKHKNCGVVPPRGSSVSFLEESSRPVLVAYTEHISCTWTKTKC